MAATRFPNFRRPNPISYSAPIEMGGMPPHGNIPYSHAPIAVSPFGFWGAHPPTVPVHPFEPLPFFGFWGAHPPTVPVHPFSGMQTTQHTIAGSSHAPSFSPFRNGEPAPFEPAQHFYPYNF